MISKVDRVELAEVIKKGHETDALISKVEILEKELAHKEDRMGWNNRNSKDESKSRPSSPNKVDNEDSAQMVAHLERRLTNYVRSLVMESNQKQEKEETTPWFHNTPHLTGPLVCLSCNQKRSTGVHDHSNVQHQHQRPGSATLGSGFQVNKKTSSTIGHALTTHLPRLNSENHQQDAPIHVTHLGNKVEKDPNGGIVIGDDGNVYKGTRVRPKSANVVYSNARNPIIHSNKPLAPKVTTIPTAPVVAQIGLVVTGNDSPVTPAIEFNNLKLSLLNPPITPGDGGTSINNNNNTRS